MDDRMRQKREAKWVGQDAPAVSIINKVESALHNASGAKRVDVDYA
jgi:hypothetical protein